jgi:predicted enzyme related to lactoylglutathione lyase
LHERRELAPGRKMLGYEATMAVDDIKSTMAAVQRAGGKIVMQPYRIDGVGELIYFEDTEGNFVGAMKYDAGVFD